MKTSIHTLTYCSCVQLVDSYLHAEWAAKRPTDPPLGVLQRIPEVNCPQQDNGNDCGVFVCKAAEYIACGRPLTYGPADMPFFRKHIALTGESEFHHVAEFHDLTVSYCSYQQDLGADYLDLQ
jgi:Ulp1 family protease